MALRFFRSKHLVARVSALAVFNVAPRVLPTAVLTEHIGTTDDGFTGDHKLFKALGTAVAIVLASQDSSGTAYATPKTALLPDDNEENNTSEE